MSKIKVPEVGESISEVTISRWMKGDGDYVEVDDLICEIESDKAALEIPADKAGLLKITVQEGEIVPVGTEIAEIDTTAAKPEPVVEPAEAGKETDEPGSPGPQPAPGKSTRVSPVAANILHEAGLTADQVIGTGKSGRITKQDAMAAIGQLQPGQTVAGDGVDGSGRQTEGAAPADWSSGPRGKRSERLSTLRRTIARRLVAAKNETAMLTTFNEADMGAIKEIRAQYKEDFKKRYDIGLGFMSFFTRAVCIALKEWPAVNAIIDGDDIQYHDYCDIGIAVSTPRGLVVPVIRNAEGLSLAEIEKQIGALAERARDHKLSMEEMSGGTFTITNGGVFGSLMSTPILNAPQSAILGMHNIIDRPVAMAGEVVIRPMMYLALSYDHRIIDGRESVSFLYRIKELLEDPHRMLLEL